MCWKKWMWIGSLLVLATLLLSVPLLSGCAISRATGPVEETDPVEPTPVNLPDPAMARDAALAYIREHDGRSAPAAGIAWKAEDATPGGLLGSTTTRYTAEDWTVTVVMPVVNPVDVVYQVTVDGQALGFHWEGKVDAVGNVMTIEEPGPVEPAPVNLPDAAMARDAVLAYIAAHDGPSAPAAGIAWNEENTTPGGLVGSTTFRYTAERWTVTVSYPIVAPEYTLYHVQVVDSASGFAWEGEMDASGTVTETPAPSPEPSLATHAVTGWLGYVVSTPHGAQFDDYVVLLPEGAGQVGIEGATEALEGEIVALRDKPEPGKMAHFWGALSCEVLDYGACQLLVTRLRYGAVATEPESVEAWQGTLVSNPPGAQFDDYFVLSGDYPVAYGLHSLDPQLQAELEALQDTGTSFHVWGTLRTGVPDSFGSQIQATRIEIQ